MAVFADEVMLCGAQVRIGPARQQFWAVWDRGARRLHERTVMRHSAAVVLRPGRLRIASAEIEADFRLEETAGIEAVCPNGDSYAWTRKQGGVEAVGSVRVGERVLPVSGRAMIDDSAGYHARRTTWRWSAGVGYALDGRPVAWNLVEGINDPPRASERTVWVQGEPAEAPPVVFADDLSGVGDLRFEAEATRARHENFGLLRSDYRQPFGTFAGVLPGGVELRSGMGVMESHDVRW